MREILFKAKRVKNGEWIEGSLIDLDIDSGYCYIVPPYKGASTLPIGFLITDGMELVIPETICQFTGMTDKNGVRIWKNDIVEAWSQGSRAIGTVKQRVDGLWIMSPAWQNHEFWELKPNSNGETTVEVLVNAFDNPELLQEVRQNEQS